MKITANSVERNLFYDGKIIMTDIMTYVTSALSLSLSRKDWKPLNTTQKRVQADLIFQLVLSDSIFL